VKEGPGCFGKVVWFIFKLTVVNFDKLRSEGLHEKLAVAAWTLGNV
jgi:hypothetical protein